MFKIYVVSILFASFFINVIANAKGKPATSPSPSTCNKGEILEVIHESGCYDKFAQAMKGANKVGDIVRKTSKVGTVETISWEVPTLDQQLGLTSYRHDVAKLVIEWKNDMAAVVPMDKPTEFIKSCRVIQLGLGRPSADVNPASGAR